MPLIRRMTRLFRADFHAVLDRIEEPDILLRQAVREMEEELARDEQACARHELEREQLAAREAELQGLLGSLGEELDVCFDAGKDDLARPLLRRRLETEQRLQMLTRHRARLARRSENLRQRIAGNRSRYEDMRQKADLFAEREIEEHPPGQWAETGISVRDEDVEVALLRERQRRERHRRTQG